jgi:hypothetical protein
MTDAFSEPMRRALDEARAQHPEAPVSLVALGDQYAIRDGHHRVSVARARGALTIDAVIDFV